MKVMLKLLVIFILFLLFFTAVIIFFWDENNKEDLKPFSIHTEAIFYDDVWVLVQRLASDKEISVWHVMTPVNYDYFKGVFCINFSKEELSDIMQERYLWLIEQGHRVELHIHFDKLGRMSFNQKEEMIKEGVEWFETKLGFKPTEFVAGWYYFDNDLLLILDKYNLTLIKQEDYRVLHDFHVLEMEEYE